MSRVRVCVRVCARACAVVCVRVRLCECHVCGCRTCLCSPGGIVTRTAMAAPSVWPSCEALPRASQFSSSAPLRLKSCKAQAQGSVSWLGRSRSRLNEWRGQGVAYLPHLGPVRVGGPGRAHGDLRVAVGRRRGDGERQRLARGVRLPSTLVHAPLLVVHHHTRYRVISCAHISLVSTLFFFF